VQQDKKTLERNQQQCKIRRNLRSLVKECYKAQFLLASIAFHESPKKNLRIITESEKNYVTQIRINYYSLLRHDIRHSWQKLHTHKVKGKEHVLFATELNT
jgi:enoyl-[acyl-carrier-protein] reductase (NADH)